MAVRVLRLSCVVCHRAPIMEAFFAKMPAQTEIKPHSDYTNFVLTAHLGLKCPEGKCWINVGDTRTDWKCGLLRAEGPHLEESIWL
jgi:aspartyl/asparaginyl beta-hydroxylase (cupin superfamily)